MLPHPAERNKLIVVDKRIATNKIIGQNKENA